MMWALLLIYLAEVCMAVRLMRSLGAVEIEEFIGRATPEQMFALHGHCVRAIMALAMGTIAAWIRT